MSGRCGAFARSGRPAFNSFRAGAGGRSATSSAARAPPSPPPLGKHTAISRPRFTCSSSRLPAELGCAMSMIPLQTAARLTPRPSLSSTALSLQGDIGADDGG